MMKLEIAGLTVELNRNTIIRGLSMAVGEGEFISLLGLSGCGKSTLLKTIAGINPVKEGTITLDGELINDKPAHKRGTVIVFQDMRGLVRRLHREFAMTTILVTHDRQEAFAMADRIAVMFDGRICAMGTPREVYRGQESGGEVAEYFKDYYLAEGVVKDGVFTATDESGMTCRINRPDGPCSLMLNVAEADMSQ